MNISFIDDEPQIYPIQYGGKARTITSLAKCFAKDSNNIVTIYSRSINSEKDHFYEDAIIYKKMSDYDCIDNILHSLKQNDVINVHTCSFTFPFIANIDKKVFYHLHDVIYATSDSGSHLDKAMGNKWSGIFSPSEFATNTYKNFNWWNKNINITTIPRSINTEMFKPETAQISISILKKYIPEKILKKSYPIILFPSRLGCGKGDKLLLEISNKLKNRYPNHLIITTGEKNTNITKNIFSVEWLLSSEMKYLYSLSDLTLNISHLPESFSHVTLESIACETPVVALPIGNIEDLSKRFKTIKIAKPNSENIANTINLTLKITNKEKNTDVQVIKDQYNPTKVTNLYLKAYQNAKTWNKTEGAEFNVFSAEVYYLHPKTIIYEDEVFAINKRNDFVSYPVTKMETLILQSLKQKKTVEELIQITNSQEDIYKILNNFVCKKIIIRSSIEETE